MRFFHTADWHLGKLVHGVYMTDDQRFILKQFIDDIENEKPDAVIIAGDLYDRSVPPTEAVDLLNEVLEKIILDLKIPVLAIAGNHDSPGRLDFGKNLMKRNGLHITGYLANSFDPVVLHDEDGEVHVYLIPYAEPNTVRHLFEDETIRTHDDAMKAIINKIKENMNPRARHIFVGHAFVTPNGEKKENTSDSERVLAIGGAEHVNADHFNAFHYVALGHLHQSHFVKHEKICYSGSPLKYSISEENHKKGYVIVDIAGEGNVNIQKKQLTPAHDMYTVEATIEEIEKQERKDDYVFVRLLNEQPVLFPMERIRSVYPNAMHVERKIIASKKTTCENEHPKRKTMDDLSLFRSFYGEVCDKEITDEILKQFSEVLSQVIRLDGEKA